MSHINSGCTVSDNNGGHGNAVSLPRLIVGTLKRAHWCQLKSKTLKKSRFYPSLDPPKSPLRRGTLSRLLSPPS